MDPQMFAAAAVFVAVAAVALYLGAGVANARRAATSRLTVYGSDALREEALKKPLSERAFAPILLGVGRGLSRCSAGSNVPSDGWFSPAARGAWTRTRGS